jgi:hypothetical protein
VAEGRRVFKAEVTPNHVSSGSRGGRRWAPERTEKLARGSATKTTGYKGYKLGYDSERLDTS